MPPEAAAATCLIPHQPTLRPVWAACVRSDGADLRFPSVAPLTQVHAPPGPTRTEVTQIADIFRAHAVDCSDRTMTLQVTGDVGKVR